MIWELMAVSGSEGKEVIVLGPVTQPLYGSETPGDAAAAFILNNRAALRDWAEQWKCDPTAIYAYVRSWMKPEASFTKVVPDVACMKMLLQLPGWNERNVT